MIGRVFRIVRTPLTLLILLGVLCWGAWWGYTNLLKPTPPTPPTPCVNQRVNQGELRSDQVTVSVFNGGSKKGLAGDVGRSLRQRGFKVTKTSNTSQKIQKTVILGAGAKNPEVLLVLRFFKDAQIKVDKRPDHSVDVLVGNDYGGFNKKAEKTLAVKSKTVCLPPQASSTAPAVNN